TVLAPVTVTVDSTAAYRRLIVVSTGFSAYAGAPPKLPANNAAVEAAAIQTAILGI
ncbi:hypothetical protein HN289_22150, partial [Acinetobacter baumannii]|nr:hypothetical protein [Acinetobacter baumannii]